ncbi:hypothetical protein [Geothrix fuzhouensis]|uniref:hypothetical protein n=1 Tax=Geothrix fuzhouensis TaxID=2966451 RepID=UPI002148D05C|nr:hypothetical protein [Geothrix fuzhouensis]
MQERLAIDPVAPTALVAITPGPNGRSIRRVGLLQAVLEAMDHTTKTRLAQKAQQLPKDTPAPPAVNRHERRKAAALARRGR